MSNDSKDLGIVGDIHGTISDFANDGINQVTNLFNPWSDGTPPGEPNYDDSGNPSSYTETDGNTVIVRDNDGEVIDKYYRS